MFEDSPDVQLPGLPEQEDQERVHVALTWCPAHLQAGAVSAVADVDVLDFAGNCGGTRIGESCRCVLGDVAVTCGC